MKFSVMPSGTLTGEFTVPGDKSISHRSIMLGAIAEGKSTITGLLKGEDVLATIEVFKQLGVKITEKKDQVEIEGVGLHGLKAPKGPLNFGNSGTGMRLMMGLLSAQSFKSTLVGDASLSIRPMKRIADPLSSMGSHIDTSDKGTPPVHITPVECIKPINYRLPIASAQLKSSLLLAGLYAEGLSVITEPEPSRDHSEKMLKTLGGNIKRVGSTIQLMGKQALQGRVIEVPADISSAAFFMVGASITPGSDILLKNIGINSTRTGVIDVLKAMGGRIDLLNKRHLGAEPIADIRVQYSPLKGINIPEAWVPLALDEFPVLFIAAACAEGQTKLCGAKELRVKESDRIAVMEQAILALGGDATATEDGMIVNGKPLLQGGATIDAQHDHRIAMACAIAALRCRQPVNITGCETVASSFPNFADLAQQAGLNLAVSV